MVLKLKLPSLDRKDQGPHWSFSFLFFNFFFLFFFSGMHDLQDLRSPTRD